MATNLIDLILISYNCTGTRRYVYICIVFYIPIMPNIDNHTLVLLKYQIYIIISKHNVNRMYMFIL